MGYIKEPKNVDLVVGPSILTSATRKTILQAIARYKKTGQKPVSLKVDKGPVEESVHIGPRKKTK